MNPVQPRRWAGPAPAPAAGLVAASNGDAVRWRMTKIGLLAHAACDRTDFPRYSGVHLASPEPGIWLRGHGQRRVGRRRGPQPGVPAPASSSRGSVPGVRIRQIALVARELDTVVAELCDALELELCFRDPGVAQFGLHNALMAIGDTFLEVVSPQRSGTTAGRLLDRRGGDGGYMVLLQTDDLAADRARAQALGVRVVWEIALPDIASVHLHPKDTGGAIVSLDQPVPPASWRWGGPSWQQVARGRDARIVGAELQAERPEAMAARWAAVLGLRHAPLGEGAFGIALQGSALRFVPVRDGRGEGLSGFDVQGPGTPRPRELALCGVRIRVA